MNEVIALTGAHGYVGSRAAAALIQRGRSVRPLGRAEGDAHFDLADGGEPEGLDGADGLVHLAYDYAPSDWPTIRRVNVEGTSRLLAAARRHGVERIVCISSVAAFAGTRSLYGRAKLEIEQIALSHGATVIRPGLVWGEEPGAMLASLQRIVTRLPVVPLLAPPELPMVMAHDEDLGALVGAALDDRDRLGGRLVVAAAPQPITFGGLLISIAASRGRRPRFVRLPWRAVWAGLRALELIGLDPPFRSDSLVSLVAVNRDPFAEQTAAADTVGVRFRPYPL